MNKKNDCPCRGCEIRMVGCHSLCQGYQQWKKDYEESKPKPEAIPELSKKTKRHIWRKLMGRR